MAPHVTIVNNAPAEVVVTISEAKDERKIHRPNITEAGDTLITEGKYRNRTFAEAKADKKYTRWLLGQQKRLVDANLLELVAYMAAEE